MSPGNSWVWALVPTRWHRVLDDIRYVVGARESVSAVAAILAGVGALGFTPDAWSLILRSAPWRSEHHTLPDPNHPVRVALAPLVDFAAIRNPNA